MKIHLRDRKTTVDDYPHCPHIIAAIDESTLAVCGVIAPRDKITDDVGEVECKACQHAEIDRFIEQWKEVL